MQPPPPYSDTVETMVAVSTETAMPIVSNQSVWRKVKIIFAARAQSSTFITGSPRFAAKREKKPRVLRSLRRFSPCSAREHATSSAERPRRVRAPRLAAGLVVVPVIFPTSSEGNTF